MPEFLRNKSPPFSLQYPVDSPVRLFLNGTSSLENRKNVYFGQLVNVGYKFEKKEKPTARV